MSNWFLIIIGTVGIDSNRARNSRHSKIQPKKETYGIKKKVLLRKEA